MSCTKHFANIQWEHHHWRPRVTAVEVAMVEEPDMWARPVYRDYVHCNKEEVCEVCGAVRRQISCMCDREKGERCAPLGQFLERTGSVLP
jgi:hypothetical protein